MSRKYKFKLPYTIGSFYVNMGLSQLKTEGLFQKLPQELQDRFEAAAQAWQGVVITQEDIDAIDMITWGAIAHKLGLDWETV